MNTRMTTTPAQTRGATYQPTSWTRPLLILTGVCSIVFTIGTTLHAFAVVDTQLIETMMRMAGGDDPAGDAPAFTTGFRIVGCVYIVGNALGMLAFVIRSAWLFWTVLAVNVTQAMGWFMIPGEMWTAAHERHGVAGVLPSAITDGGAALLVAALVAGLIRVRGPWAQQRLRR